MNVLDISSKFLIKYIVCTNKHLLGNEDNNYNIQIFECLDARSAAYFACGIAEKTNALVLLCVKDGAETRSIYSGATEAYYKQLKLIVLSISLDETLDYKREIKDCFTYSKSADSNSFESELKKAIAFSSSHSLPSHLQLMEENALNKCEYSNPFDIVSRILSINSADFFICLTHRFFDCGFKVSPNIITCGHYGALSCLAGASLAKKRKKYIGIFDEKEVLIELNVFGNREIADNISIVVLSKRNDLVENYSKALGFECIILDEQNWRSVFAPGKKIFFTP